MSRCLSVDHCVIAFIITSIVFFVVSFLLRNEDNNPESPALNVEKCDLICSTYIERSCLLCHGSTATGIASTVLSQYCLLCNFIIEVHDRDAKRRDRNAFQTATLIHSISYIIATWKAQLLNTGLAPDLSAPRWPCGSCVHRENTAWKAESHPLFLGMILLCFSSLVASPVGKYSGEHSRCLPLQQQQV